MVATASSMSGTVSCISSQIFRIFAAAVFLVLVGLDLFVINPQSWVSQTHRYAIYKNMHTDTSANDLSEHDNSIFVNPIWQDAAKCYLVSRGGDNRSSESTLRDLLHSWPKNKTRGFIYLLVPPMKLKNLPNLLKNIYDSFNKRFKYPVVVFSESADAPSLLRAALAGFDKQNEIAEVFAYDISAFWHVPGFVLEKHNNSVQELTRFCLESIRGAGCRAGKSLGYWLMCRFHAKIITEIPFVSEFDYIWRLDADSVLCGPINFDLFTFMKDKDYYQGYVLVKNYDSCTRFLTQHVHKYISDYGIIPMQGESSVINAGNNYIYNNFEIFKVEFYQRKEYRSFVNLIDESGGFFYYRWGDAPVRTQASHLLMAKEKMYQFKRGEVFYHHQSTNLC